jgi:hypothetical protein
MDLQQTTYSYTGCTKKNENRHDDVATCSVIVNSNSFADTRMKESQTCFCFMRTLLQTIHS